MCTQQLWWWFGGGGHKGEGAMTSTEIQLGQQGQMRASGALRVPHWFVMWLHPSRTNSVPSGVWHCRVD